MNTYFVAAQTRPTQVQTRQNPCTEKGSEHQVPPQTKKLFEINICWERSVLSDGVSQGSSATLPAAPARSAVQHKMDFIFFFFLHFLFCLGIFFSYWIFHLIFILGERKNMKLGREGGWVFKKLGEEKNMIKNICYFFKF